MKAPLVPPRRSGTAKNRQRPDAGAVRAVGRFVRSKAGFTLVEMAVVLVLAAMLLALAGVGLSAYVRSAKFRRQNETARALYLAAQTQLTQYVADGRSALLGEACSRANQLNLGESMTVRLTGENGAPVTTAAIWKSRSAGDAVGTLYTLTGTAQDYAAYRAGTLSDVRLTRLYDIFDAYLYDKSVLNATVCIEFDPVEGLVYSVLYSQDAAGFTYTGEAGKTDITDRTEAARRPLMLGYYGVETLSRAVSSRSLKPVIQKVMLHNENTLNLTWNLSRLPEATGELTYTVEVCDAATGKCIMALRLNNLGLTTGNDRLTAADSTEKSPTIEARVSRAAEEGGTLQELGIYTFPAWVDADGVVHLVLDAADLGATESEYAALLKNAAGKNTSAQQQLTGANLLADTFSLHRFLPEELGAENLFCRVRGDATGAYKQTASKTSNTENAFFGSFAAGSDSRTYTLYNARHLYNLRFAEAEGSPVHTGGPAVDYQLSADFAWNGEGGLVEAGALYTDKSAVGLHWEAQKHGALARLALTADGEADFPGISSLRAGSTLETASGAAHAIGGLSLSYRTDEAAAVPGYDASAGGPTGLFLQNSGTLQNLALRDVSAVGFSSVGAFCGVNAGALDRLENAGGTVYGGQNVGGIFGLQTTPKKNAVTFAKLVNRAEVVGHTYVGGITGYLSPKNGSGGAITLENCTNTGSVRGDWDPDATGETGLSALFNELYGQGKKDYSAEPSDIGGIAGYLGSNNKNTAAVLKNCTSAPACPRLDAVLAAVKAGRAADVLRGRYVGGIVGLCSGGQVTNCSTSLDREAPTYVLGGQYVGGIAGYSTTALAGSSSRANVLGVREVGGITGRSGAIGGFSGSGAVTVSGWKVQGVVLASESYAGGITGYNAGTVKNCTVQVEYGAAAQKLLAAFGRTADYVGGMIGYNTGALTADRATGVTAVAAGRDYVGGVVGYQAAGSSVLVSYSLQGGYVFGRDFVGGFVGVCLNDAVLAQPLSAAPGQVSGRYYVGGGFGGIVCAPSADRTLSFSCDNFLGTVQGDLAVGGVAGAVVTCAPGATAAKTAALLADTVSGMSGLADYSADTALTRLGQLAVKTAPAGGFSARLLTLNGRNGAVHFGAVRAALLTGGVAGWVPDGVRLAVTDTVNQTPVTALSAVQSAELGAGDTLYYSYAGGILGQVGANTCLINCRNQGSGAVSSAGSLTGGLTEVNRGAILYCSAGSLGAAGAANVGGIAGLNLANGSLPYSVTYQSASYSERGILSCSVSATLTGADCLGGLAARNYGLLRDPVLAKVLLVSGGGRAGGAAGLNGSVTARTGLLADTTAVCTGRIVYTAASGTQQLNVSAQGSASGLGALAGSSDGGTFEKPAGLTLEVPENQSLAGSETVGGFFGELLGGNGGRAVTGLVNRASVDAECGLAGGIAAVCGPELSGCRNYGAVEVKAQNAAGTADAGGITAHNAGTLSACADFGTVRSTNGAAGGIAARNSGRISGCQVGKTGLPLSFTGRLLAGGIAGENSGTIENSCSCALTLELLSTGKNGLLGGIAGKNSGAITRCRAGASFAAPEAPGTAGDVPVSGGGAALTLRSAASPAFAGGLAGENTGVITGEQERYTAAATASAGLSFTQTDLNFFGDLGGLVGRNEGTVRYASFSGSVAGTANDPSNSPTYDPNVSTESGGAVLYGYGGIAGVNGASGRIENCFVSDADIRGIGDPSNIVNVGGIAGVNGVGGLISGVDFGSGETRTQKVSLSGYLGPDGENVGSAAEYGVSVLVSASQYGHAGGVAGYNLGAVDTVCPVAGETASTAADKRVSPASRVAVSVLRGHVGGIVGYDRPSGTIRGASTGSGWLVFAENTAQDNGCGGIAGYWAGENDLSDCRSWACVFKTVNLSNGVGGMIGRCEIATTGAVHLTNCVNYGPVSAYDRAGGMIGVTKYHTLSLIGCANFGPVRAGSSAAGGMVGMIYSVSDPSETFTLTGCENHGTVGKKGTSQNGGILGGFGGNANIRLSISSCVNTGLICGSGGGILGAGNNRLLAGSRIAACINYGLPATGLAGTVYGIAQNLSHLTITKCIGVGALGSPLSNGGSGTSDYHFYARGTGLGTRLTVGGSAGSYTGLAGGTEIFKNLPLDPSGLDTARDAALGTDAGLAVTGGADNGRYTFYKTEHPYFIEQMSSAGAGSVSTPTFTDKGGSSLVKWSPDAGGAADFYKVTVTFTDAQGRVVQTGEYTVCDTQVYVITSGHAGETLSVTVTPYTLAGKAGTGASASRTVGELLPTPQFHLHLAQSGSSYVYRILLDNAADYTAFAAAHPDTGLTPEKTGITVTVGGTAYSFTAAEGAAAKTYSGTGGTSNISFTASAAPAAGVSGVDSSLSQTRESMAPGGGVLTGTGGVAKVDLTGSGRGFVGTTADSLSYRLGIAGSAGYTLYMRSELTAVDAALGVPVTVSSSLLRTSTLTADYVSTLLPSLPAELFTPAYTDLAVRSYPSMMSNNVVYMGHSVALSAPLSRAELKKLYVTADGAVSAQGTAGALPLLDASGAAGYTDGVRSGYVIELSGSGLYTLYYNPLSAAVGLAEEKTAADGAVKMKNQVFYTYLGAVQLQPAPAVTAGLNAAYTRLSVQWDSVSTETGYTYTVTGVLTDTHGTDAADDDTETDVVIDTGTVGVRQSGVYDAGTGLYSLGCSASGWTYDKIRVSVTRNGSKNAAGVTVLQACTGEAETAFKKALSTPVQPTAEQHAESGITAKDDHLYDIRWTGLTDSSEQADLDCYLVTLTGKNAAGEQTTLSWRTGTDSAAADDTAISGADLNGFDGCTVYIQVQALAKADAAHRSSAQSPARELEVPERLTPPVLSAMFTGGGTGTVVSVDEFCETGFALSMAAGSDFNAGSTGSYELGIDVCGAENGTVLKTLYPQSAPARMAGDFTLGSYTLAATGSNGFDASLANRWLRVSARAVSASRISSVWTDSPLAAGYSGVTGYAYIHLPRVRVDAAGLTASTAACAVLQSKDGQPLEDLPSSYLQTNQDTVSFAVSDYARGCRIDLSQADAEKNADRIRLEKTASGWAVYYRTTDASQNTASADYTAGEVPLGTLADGGSLALPYRATLTDAPYSAVLISQLACSGGVFTLTLPDTETISNTDTGYAEANFFTRSVCVTELAQDENYADSLQSCWYRTRTGATDATVTAAGLTEASAPALTASGTSAQAANGTDGRLQVPFAALADPSGLDTAAGYAACLTAPDASGTSRSLWAPVVWDGAAWQLLLPENIWSDGTSAYTLTGTLTVFESRPAAGYGCGAESSPIAAVIVLPAARLAAPVLTGVSDENGRVTGLTFVPPAGADTCLVELTAGSSVTACTLTRTAGGWAVTADGTALGTLGAGSPVTLPSGFSFGLDASGTLSLAFNDSGTTRVGVTLRGAGLADSAQVTGP